MQMGERCRRSTITPFISASRPSLQTEASPSKRHPKAPKDWSRVRDLRLGRTFTSQQHNDPKHNHRSDFEMAERAWVEQPEPKHLWRQLTSAKCFSWAALSQSSAFLLTWVSKLSVSSSAEVDRRVGRTKIKRARAATAQKAESGREQERHSSSLQEYSETEIWF